jgi:hypothetical protein
LFSKSVDCILQPDPRFADLSIVANGVIRPIALADHHSTLARARLTDLVSDYDLIVVGRYKLLAPSSWL